MRSVPLFVYGTLMRGHRRHDLLAGGAFLGSATTAEPMILVDCGGYPAMVCGANGDSVTGEVFLVSPDLLSVLDDYEAVPEGEYVREEIRVVLGETGSSPRPVQAYLYARDTSALPLVGSRWTLQAERDPEQRDSA